MADSVNFIKCGWTARTR